MYEASTFSPTNYFIGYLQRESYAKETLRKTYVHLMELIFKVETYPFMYKVLTLRSKTSEDIECYCITFLLYSYSQSTLT